MEHLPLIVFFCHRMSHLFYCSIFLGVATHTHMPKKWRCAGNVNFGSSWYMCMYLSHILYGYANISMWIYDIWYIHFFYLLNPRASHSQWQFSSLVTTLDIIIQYGFVWKQCILKSIGVITIFPIEIAFFERVYPIFPLQHVPHPPWNMWNCQMISVSTNILGSWRWMQESLHLLG